MPGEVGHGVVHDPAGGSASTPCASGSDSLSGWPWSPGSWAWRWRPGHDLHARLAPRPRRGRPTRLFVVIEARDLQAFVRRPGSASRPSGRSPIPRGATALLLGPPTTPMAASPPRSPSPRDACRIALPSEPSGVSGLADRLRPCASPCERSAVAESEPNGQVLPLLCGADIDRWQRRVRAPIRPMASRAEAVGARWRGRRWASRAWGSDQEEADGVGNLLGQRPLGQEVGSPRPPGGRTGTPARVTAGRARGSRTAVARPRPPGAPAAERTAHARKARTPGPHPPGQPSIARGPGGVGVGARRQRGVGCQVAYPSHREPSVTGACPLPSAFITQMAHCSPDRTMV